MRVGEVKFDRTKPKETEYERKITYDRTENGNTNKMRVLRLPIQHLRRTKWRMDFSNLQKLLGNRSNGEKVFWPKRWCDSARWDYLGKLSLGQVSALWVSPSSSSLVTEGSGGMILGVSLVNPTNGSAADNIIGSVELIRKHDIWT